MIARRAATTLIVLMRQKRANRSKIPRFFFVGEAQESFILVRYLENQKNILAVYA
jgi:hypothetical protein